MCRALARCRHDGRGDDGRGDGLRTLSEGLCRGIAVGAEGESVAVVLYGRAFFVEAPFGKPVEVLVKHFGVTVLLCTATQPALNGEIGATGRAVEGIDECTEIIEDTAALYDSLKRVEYRIYKDSLQYRASWEEKRHAPPPEPQSEKGTNIMRELEDFRKYANAVNADRYRVTCIRMEVDGGKKTFILDKKGGMTRGFSPAELEAHMPEMLRFQKRGENIYYTPLSDGRYHILIDDLTRDSLQRLQEDGFRPAVVLESSPGNFQCLLTIPKLGTEHDRDVGNRITERLNREYGDKKLCGCVHPHRAPGFENRKPKHRREDGGYPQVKLLFAERRECGKALALTRRIDREYAEAAKKRLAERRTFLMPNFRPGDPAAAYYAHLENIRRHLTIEDYSRVDAMIALRMRANGHSREAVEETIRACAPTIRETPVGRNWQRYAERTAAYAFGPAGDRDMERNERYRELWKRVEGMEEMERKQTRTRMRQA